MPKIGDLSTAKKKSVEFGEERAVREYERELGSYREDCCTEDVY